MFPYLYRDIKSILKFVFRHHVDSVFLEVVAANSTDKNRPSTDLFGMLPNPKKDHEIFSVRVFKLYALWSSIGLRPLNLRVQVSEITYLYLSHVFRWKCNLDSGLVSVWISAPATYLTYMHVYIISSWVFFALNMITLNSDINSLTLPRLNKL